MIIPSPSSSSKRSFAAASFRAGYPAAIASCEATGVSSLGYGSSTIVLGAARTSTGEKGTEDYESCSKQFSKKNGVLTDDFSQNRGVSSMSDLS